ncbi:unnamed protein product [Lymnaea stagnalis]|uniref:Carbonic anhydrase n=1 Tax=Lymnaea stagnalis TaxID=6523 RepID=A0AAV2HKM6_LYMST
MSIDVPELVKGVYKNTGNYLIFTLDDDISNSANFSDGPFMYTYRMSVIQLHLGTTNSKGSEHRIDGKSFGAEVHIICFNSNLFKSLQEAQKMPYGVAIFAIFAEISEGTGTVNSAFSLLIEKAIKINLQGQEVRLETFNAKALLPATDYYITYEGSFTYPGCYETVTWVIFNRPILIQASQLDIIRQLQKRQQDTRMTMMGGNLRPTMPVNNRAIRTNINYHTSGGLCDMKRVAFYEVNEILRH